MKQPKQPKKKRRIVSIKIQKYGSTSRAFFSLLQEKVVRRGGVAFRLLPLSSFLRDGLLLKSFLRKPEKEKHIVVGMHSHVVEHFIKTEHLKFSIKKANEGNGNKRRDGRIKKGRDKRRNKDGNKNKMRKWRRS